MRSERTEVTVVGDDDTGLLARITSLLFEREINIEGIDQAVRDGLFRMTMHIDTREMEGSRDSLRKDLTELCDELGVDVQLRFPTPSETQSIAVLVTKESHCLTSMLKEYADGEHSASVEVVIGNHSELEPIVTEFDVPFHDIGDEKGSPDEGELLSLLSEYNTDLVVLARYIRILSPNVVFRYENRIINVHPSLLPAFPGAKAYIQAIEEGVRIAGVTAHYVTPDLDQGPIITQRAFNVPDDATKEDLMARGQPLESEALLEAVDLHLNDTVEIGRDRTHVRNIDEAILGLPSEIGRLNPSAPIDDGHTGIQRSEGTAND